MVTFIISVLGVMLVASAIWRFYPSNNNDLLKDIKELKRLNEEATQLINARKQYLIWSKECNLPTAWWDNVHTMD